MFKKLKTVGVVVACLAASSCTVVHTAVVTNNPVGSKVGKSSSKPFQKVQGTTYKAALEDGGITTVGVSELKVKSIIIGFKQNLVVTGE